MIKKKKKCIDCGKRTSDYYTVHINKGKIYKCVECYEVSMLRENRMTMKTRPNKM